MKIIITSVIGLLISLNSFAENSVDSKKVNALTNEAVVNEYNANRKEFLKKKELIMQKYRQQRQTEYAQELIRLEESRKFQIAKDNFRIKHGIPISRFQNNQGPSGTESGISREMMSALSNGAPLPKVPPTGNIQEAR